jgi:hypothetical protein
MYAIALATSPLAGKQGTLILFVMSLLTGLKATLPSTSADMRISFARAVRVQRTFAHTKQAGQVLRGFQELGRADGIVLALVDWHVLETLGELVEEGLLGSHGCGCVLGVCIWKGRIQCLLAKKLGL